MFHRHSIEIHGNRFLVGTENLDLARRSKLAHSTSTQKKVSVHEHARPQEHYDFSNAGKGHQNADLARKTVETAMFHSAHRLNPRRSKRRKRSSNVQDLENDMACHRRLFTAFLHDSDEGRELPTLHLCRESSRRNSAISPRADKLSLKHRVEGNKTLKERIRTWVRLWGQKNKDIAGCEGTQNSCI